MADPDLNQAEQSIDAETIHVQAGFIDHVDGDQVQILKGGANVVSATIAEMNTAGALAVQGQQVDIERSGVGIIQGNEVKLYDSNSVAILADQLDSSESRIGVTISNTANLNNSTSFLLLARELNGDVDTVLDQRAAALVGIAAGVVIGFFVLVGQLFGRYRK